VLNGKKRTAICSEVAGILKAEREKRRLSMTAVAAQAGLSQQMVSYVERGIRNPTLETLLRITGALDINLAEVISRATAGHRQYRANTEARHSSPQR
jgi:transcriptional regulator with XRE-family HTH domain